MKRIQLGLMVALLMALGGTTAHAALGAVQTQVMRTLVDDQLFGGCMAFLAAPPPAELNCEGQWVTFSCTGFFNSKDFAYRKFDSAQLAYALQKNVVVTVDDTKKHNGFCFAKRIDLVP